MSTKGFTGSQGLQRQLSAPPVMTTCDTDQRNPNQSVVARVHGNRRKRLVSCPEADELESRRIRLDDDLNGGPASTSSTELSFASDEFPDRDEEEGAAAANASSTELPFVSDEFPDLDEDEGAAAASASFRSPDSVDNVRMMSPPDKMFTSETLISSDEEDWPDSTRAD